MKSHICRIGVGARNASQEEVKVIHICHVKFFQKMRYLLLDWIIIIWELKAKEEQYRC